MLAVLAALAAAAGPLAAQSSGAAGRWRVEVGGATAPLQGELRLAERGGRLTGEFALENSDSGPVSLTGRLLSDSTIEFTVPLGVPTRFAGHVGPDHLEGIVEGSSLRSWSASRLPLEMEYYPVLPRFTLAEVIAGRRDSTLRIPGRWLAAARALPAAAVQSAYADAARRAGVAPLDSATLRTDGSLRSFGLYRRAEYVAAMRRTLELLRAGIASDTVRARFDYLFRPRGEWLVDLHDAALLRAQLRLRGTTWSAAMPALRAVSRVADGGDPVESVPLAMYRLLTLAAADSGAVSAQLVLMRRAEPASAAAVAALLEGYRQATAWTGAAASFLLNERWLPGGAGLPEPHSPAELVRQLWLTEDRASVERADELPAPELQVTLFGYPQAVPRYGVPPMALAALVRADNWTAEAWVHRHGAPALLALLRRLPADSGPATTFAAGGESFRLTSVRRQAQESLNGFLEPFDAVRFDPGYAPLFALGTVIHEWQHILFERIRLQRAVARTARAGTPVTLPSTDPYVAEGFAEWRTERALSPIVAQLPLLGLPEAEKRARLALTDPADPHVLGYLLVRAAADGIADPGRVSAALLRRGDDFTLLAADPVFAGRWARYAAAPDRVLMVPSRRVLVPETTFTVEDGYPDLVSTRILQPSR